VARLIKSESNKLRPTSTAGSVCELLTGHEYTRAAQCFSRIDPASITDARCPAPSCLRVGKLQLFEKFGGVGKGDPGGEPCGWTISCTCRRVRMGPGGCRGGRVDVTEGKRASGREKRSVTYYSLAAAICSISRSVARASP
jgi:hypothetical protein